MTVQPWAFAAREVWHYQIEVPPVALHAAPDDSYLLVADVLGRVRCLDPASGALRWERDEGLENVGDLRATLGGPTVLLQEGRLLRLTDDGELVWEASVGPLRAGFDATADGARIAVSAPVHEVVDGEVRVGAEITLWDGDGAKMAALRVDRTVSRLRFTSEAGDLVAASPEGVVRYLAANLTTRGEARIGSVPEGLVSCLDGSLILVPSATDGVHVLTAAGRSVGVLSVAGGVEDVDVSENGAAILVKERDGLITLLDGAFRPRWQDRMPRPVLRVDLAADGSFAYVAEATGRVARLDFDPAARAVPEIVQSGASPLKPAAEWELAGTPVRAGLGRAAFVGPDGHVAVLGRPEQVTLCAPGGGVGRGESLPGGAAHLTADPHRPRMTLWSARSLVELHLDGAQWERSGEGISAVVYLPDGDLVLGTTAGQVVRLGPARTEERFAVPVGAAVTALLPLGASGDLAVLCADATLLRLSGAGEVMASRDLSRSAVANPDVVARGGEADALEGASAPRQDADFWRDFARAFQLRAHAGGLVVFHGSGRLLRLTDRLAVTQETRLDREVADVQPLGEGLLVVEEGGLATVLDGALAETHRFTLGCPQAQALMVPGEAPLVLDASEEAVWLRGVDGTVLAEAEVYPAPRCLVASPDRTLGAVLIDTRLLLIDPRPR